MGLNIGHHFLFAPDRVFGLEGWGIVGLGPQVKSPRKKYGKLLPQHASTTKSVFLLHCPCMFLLTPIVRAPTTLVEHSGLEGG